MKTLLTTIYLPFKYATIMKALLGILLSIILLQAQVVALSGGPDYNRGGGSVANIVGTYGGVMVEQTDPVDNTNGGSVAVYSVNIAQTGTSIGSLLVFDSGRVYPGTMTGIGASDTKSSTFKAIIEASFNYTLFVGTDSEGKPVTIDVSATTNGTLNTKIETVRVGAFSNLTMTGTATLNVSNGSVDGDGTQIIQRVIDYVVSGYRQTAAT